MSPTRGLVLFAIVAALSLTACAQRQTQPAASADSHAAHEAAAPAASATTASAVVSDTTLPADANAAAARLAASPRHGEYVMIPAGGADSVRAWVVYPERSTKAPVVLVVHEIFGLSSWVRAVADQLAREGFIAIAPDFLTGKRLPAAPDALTSVPGGVDSAIALIRALDQGEIVRRAEAAARYATSLPAATSKWGVVGFCWGGTQSFAIAAASPTLSAAVPYYGAASPKQMDLTRAKAPVLAMYGEKDARVDMTIPYADSALRAAGATFEKRVFAGAGHGFLRQQDGQNGANLQAARAAWPLTIQWFRRYLRG